MGISVLLADDHVLVRQGLRSLLDRGKIQVIAEASDGQEAIHLVEAHHPEVAVIDISMPTPALSRIQFEHERLQLIGWAPKNGRLVCFASSWANTREPWNSFVVPYFQAAGA